MTGLTLSGSISLEQVAERLDTSPRTLQRRLHDGDIRFRIIVEESRFGIAGALLRETELSVAEIAKRIGYGAPGAFSRAFGKWAGCAPRAYQRAARHPERGA